MRVLVISHAYTTPANRGKLRALAARGLDVTVGVPQRWREEGVLGRTLEVAWERQNGVEVFPVPVRHPGSPDVLRFGGGAPPVPPPGTPPPPRPGPGGGPHPPPPPRAPRAPAPRRPPPLPFSSQPR